ncbi:MAG: hypothetical protein LBF66_03060 [Holosporales bacterium]|jgi:hypothetical protein|nr:hypothetical protein [Holosporales bacterium]
MLLRRSVLKFLVLGAVSLLGKDAFASVWPRHSTWGSSSAQSAVNKKVCPLPQRSASSYLGSNPSDTHDVGPTGRAGVPADDSPEHKPDVTDFYNKAYNDSCGVAARLRFNNDK